MIRRLLARLDALFGRGPRCCPECGARMLLRYRKRTVFDKTTGRRLVPVSLEDPVIECSRVGDTHPYFFRNTFFWDRVGGS